MKLLCYTPIEFGHPNRFPIKAKEFLGNTIENRPRELTPDMGYSQWMLDCWEDAREKNGIDMWETILIFKANNFEILDEYNFLSQVFGLIASGTDLIGYAGTDSFDPSHRLPSGGFPMWFQYFPIEGRRGLVQQQTTGYMIWTLYGVPGTVKVIDGACMICSGRLYNEIRELIHPLFHRDWWDISFSYNCHKKGHKIYVINCPVRCLTHGKFGDGWIQEGHKFFDHYSQKFPTIEGNEKCQIEKQNPLVS